MSEEVEWEEEEKEEKEAEKEVEAEKKRGIIVQTKSNKKNVTTVCA